MTPVCSIKHMGIMAGFNFRQGGLVMHNQVAVAALRESFNVKMGLLALSVHF